MGVCCMVRSRLPLERRRVSVTCVSLSLEEGDGLTDDDRMKSRSETTAKTSKTVNPRLPRSKAMFEGRRMKDEDVTALSPCIWADQSTCSINSECPSSFTHQQNREYPRIGGCKYTDAGCRSIAAASRCPMLHSSIAGLYLC